MNIIGQEELLGKINRMSLNTLPHVILLEGIKGSGRHTLSYQLAQQVGLFPLILGKEALSTLEGFGVPLQNLFIFDLTGLYMKEQNELLKTLEEPSEGFYIVLLCENVSEVLPTIISRCTHWKLSDYTTEELREIAAFHKLDCDEIIFDIARVPGDIMELVTIDIKSISALVHNIIENIGKANYANILVLPEKIQEFSETGTVKFDTFLKIFLCEVRQRIRKDPDIRYRNIYFELQDLYKLHRSAELMHLNEQQLYEKFLFDLKVVAR